MQKLVKIRHFNLAQMAEYAVVRKGRNNPFLRNKFIPAPDVATAMRQREVEHVVGAAPRFGNDMLNCYRLIRKLRKSEHHYTLAVDAAIAVAFFEGGDPVGSDCLRLAGDRLLRNAGAAFGKLCGHGRSATTAMAATRTVTYIMPIRASW